jgi:GTP cyclohydrolase I
MYEIIELDEVMKGSHNDNTQENIFRNIISNLSSKHSLIGKAIKLDASQLSHETNGVGNSKFNGITKGLITKINKDKDSRNVFVRVKKEDSYKDVDGITKYSKVSIAFVK